MSGWGGWDPGEGGEERGRGPGVGRAGWDPGQGRKGVEKQGGAGPAKVGPPGGGARWGLSDLGLRLFVHYLSENSC